MSTTRIFFWLKLKEDFFRQKIIKKFRTLKKGDTYVIIYLKMQLLSLKDEGKLFFDDFEDDFASELALELDEKLEDVRATLQVLEKFSQVLKISENTYEIPDVMKNLGKETSDAERKRVQRTKKSGHCPPKVGHCPPEIELELEIEKELEIERELEEKENKKEKEKSHTHIQLSEFVSMSEENHKKLIAQHGEEATSWMINKLDAYKGSSGKTYKDDYRAIQTWVVKAYQEEKKNVNNRTAYDRKNDELEKLKNPTGERVEYTPEFLESLFVR